MHAHWCGAVGGRGHCLFCSVQVSHCLKLSQISLGLRLTHVTWPLSTTPWHRITGPAVPFCCVGCSRSSVCPVDRTKGLRRMVSTSARDVHGASGWILATNCGYPITRSVAALYCSQLRALAAVVTLFPEEMTQRTRKAKKRVRILLAASWNSWYQNVRLRSSHNVSCSGGDSWQRGPALRVSRCLCHNDIDTKTRAQEINCHHCASLLVLLSLCCSPRALLRLLLFLEAVLPLLHICTERPVWELTNGDLPFHVMPSRFTKTSGTFRRHSDLN